MQKITLPKRGQAMEEGTILEWTVEEGDAVEAGEPILLFETNKTTAELEAEQDGCLLATLVDPGETVPIGTTLGYIGTDAERDSIPESKSKTGAVGESTAADASSPEEALAADVEIRSSPSARRAARERGISVEAVGRELGVRRVRQEHVERFADDRSAADILGSPAARRIAENHGVNVTAVGEAVGERRVRMADVEKYVKTTEGSGTVHEPDQPADDRTVYDSIPVTGARKTMHDRMQRVASEYGSTTTVAKVDVTDLRSLRESLSDAWTRRHDVSPSLTAFVVRAAAESLSEYRILNAEIVTGDGEATEVRQFSDVNVGIAVNTDHGLLVPTIYGADERTVRELSGEIANLADAARARELDFEAQQNATFTVSNAGTFGAYINTPQINPPQTAILGTCAVVEEPGIVDGEILPREFMHLCLSYDHRVVEGATAVQFLQDVKDRLEEPASLLA